jgi:hypothetical protein
MRWLTRSTIPQVEQVAKSRPASYTGGLFRVFPEESALPKRIAFKQAVV